MLMTRSPTDEGRRDLDRLIARSKRSSGARLPSAFARSDSEYLAPLAVLLQGGRGGEVRLKLYISIVLLAGSMREHPVLGRNCIDDVSGATWARVLALTNPRSAGARRISDAQNQLAERDLITVERRAAQPPIVRLLHGSGSGDDWVEPTVPYIRIPLTLWEQRWLWYLSGKELAVLIALIDLCDNGGRDQQGGPQALSSEDPTRYDLSEDTWRLASKSLEAKRLVKTDQVVRRRDLESPRLRKTYDLNLDALTRSPETPARRRRS